jgi:hypothetical protein
LNEAQQRNFKQWDILGKFVWRSTPGFEQRKFYQMEVDYLKTFLNNRLAWMDSKLKLLVTDIDDDATSSNTLINTPNPFTRETIIQYKLQKPGMVSINIFDGVGKQIRTLRIIAHEPEGKITLDATGLNPGIYYCVLYSESGKIATTKMILQQ